MSQHAHPGQSMVNHLMAAVLRAKQVAAHFPGDHPPGGLLLCTDKDQTKVEPSGANRVERDSLHEVQPARAGAAAHGKQPARRTARRGERGSANQYATGGLDHQLFVSRYLVALPKPEPLEQLIETDRVAWEQHHPNSSPTEDQP